MDLNVEKLNEILANLDHIKLKKVSDVEPRDYWQEKYQGGNSQKVVVYDLEDGSGLFLKIVSETDSYGDNEKTTSIQFVRPTTKTVTVFE